MPPKQITPRRTLGPLRAPKRGASTLGRTIARMETISYSGRGVRKKSISTTTELEGLTGVITDYASWLRDRKQAVRFAKALLDPEVPNPAILKAAMDYLEAVKEDEE